MKLVRAAVGSMGSQRVERKRLLAGLTGELMRTRVAVSWVGLVTLDAFSFGVILNFLEISQ